MLKPQQIRHMLADSVPLLKRNPDSLNMFIDSGRIASTLASSLSFEYQYQLNLVVTDYGDSLDLLIVPLLAWLRKTSPTLWQPKKSGAPASPSKPMLSATRCVISALICS